MPQVYTIATKNAFAALDDTVDDEAIQARPDELDRPGEKTAPVAEPKPAKKDTRGPNKPRAPRNNEESAPRRRAENAGTEAEGEHRRPRLAGHRTKTAPTRRGEPLEYSDRVSGTGRGKEMKKEGGGAHNWGNQTADFGDASTVPATGAVEGEAAEPTTPVATEEAARPAAESDEPKLLSYDAYKAEHAAKLEAAMPQKKNDDAEVAAAEKQKLLSQGYQIHYKEEQQMAPAKKSTTKSGEAPKAIHLAELAAQAGGQLRYQGDRARPRRDNERRAGSPNEERRGGKNEDKRQGKKEINLADQQAFPTLQAH